MPPQTTSLPDDLDALKTLLLQRDDELQRLRDTVSTLELALSVRTLEIEQLKLQIAKFKRMQFGRKSEKLDRKIEQLETRLEDLIAEEGAAEQKLPTAVVPRQKSAHQPLPDHLPREEHIIEPEEEACPQCGGNLKPLGEDVSEQLEMIEAAFKVIRHVRRKKACACCDCIVQAPAPSRPIQRSFAGPGLLANIAVSKFADHQPLYRQAVIHARRGVELDPSTTGRWMGVCGVLVHPLVEALRRCRYSLREMDKPRPDDYGCMFGTTAIPVLLHRRQCGLLILPTGKASIRSLIWSSSAACCRRTPTPPTIRFLPMAASKRLLVWPTQEGRCMIYTSVKSRQRQPKYCAELANCMRLNHKFADNLLMNASASGNCRRGRFWTNWKSGCGTGC
jgi:transposase